MTIRDLFDHLSRRERQIMNVLVLRGDASVEDVRKELPDPPSYDSVRTTLRILEEKSMIVHRRDGRRFLYRPVQTTEGLKDNALTYLVNSFFGGKPEAAALALIRSGDLDISEKELKRLEQMLERGDR